MNRIPPNPVDGDAFLTLRIPAVRDKYEGLSKTLDGLVQRNAELGDVPASRIRKLRDEAEIYGEDLKRLTVLQERFRREIPEYQEALKEVEGLQSKYDRQAEKSIRAISELLDGSLLSAERERLLKLFQSKRWQAPDSIAKNQHPFLIHVMSKLPIDFNDLVGQVAEARKKACFESRVTAFQQQNEDNETIWQKTQLGDKNGVLLDPAAIAAAKRARDEQNQQNEEAWRSQHEGSETEVI